MHYGWISEHAHRAHQGFSGPEFQFEVTGNVSDAKQQQRYIELLQRDAKQPQIGGK